MEHVEREVKKRPSIPELEEEVDGLLNIPVKHGELWIKELDDRRFTINPDDPDDPKITCAEVQVVHEDLEKETIKARNEKYIILGDIPDMDRARLVRVRKGAREIEEEEGE